jgi:isopenicillin-N N-acyltransferase-like protein
MTAGEPSTVNAFRYPEAAHGAASLAYVGPIPVLRVCGSPEDIAEQSFALAVRPAARLLDYPFDLLAFHFRSRLLARLLVRPLDRLGRRLVPRLPPPHRRELEALAALAGEVRVVRANTLFDLKNTPPWRLLGCSSLAPAPDRSDTGVPLLARNLDFFPLGYLHEYSLLTVYAPEGARKFAAVAFPGGVGCFSGMNDAGLAAVSHEVFGPPGRGFDPRGVPFAAALRRVLETCATVDEAESYLRSIPRATSVSLVVCDRETPTVFELSPERVVRRDPVRGVSVCTNHFVGAGLASPYPPDTFGSVRRHRLLGRVATSGSRLGLADLFAVLHAVNMGPMTIQSMVFEPTRLRLHLSLGPGPTTALAPTELRLADWF